MKKKRMIVGIEFLHNGYVFTDNEGDSFIIRNSNPVKILFLTIRNIYTGNTTIKLPVDNINNLREISYRYENISFSYPRRNKLAAII